MSPESKTALNVTQAVPFFFVSNLEQSIRYYVDGLGFEMINQWIDQGKLRWCWLQHGGAALMLQQFPKTWVPEGKLGQGVSVWFQCRDALSIYHDLTARAIQISRPFVGNAMWVTTLSDPDGYKLHFASPTDVPEGTDLSSQLES